MRFINIYLYLWLSINSSTIYQKDFPFSIGLLQCLCQKSIECIRVGLLLDFPLIYLSILTLKHTCLITEDLQKVFKADRSNHLSLFFFKIVLAILAPLESNVNFRISLSTSTKTCAGILIGIVITLQINLERTEILTYLSIDISSLIFLDNSLQFSVGGYCIYFNLFLSTLQFLNAIVNGIFKFNFLIVYCSCCSYRNTTDFCILSFVLKLCLVHLLTLIVFLQVLQDVLCTQYYYLQMKTVLVLCFQTGCHFFLFMSLLHQLGPPV